ncbi:neuronal acetylcholine receptor subunit alpha-3-like [Ruditapes philippinarum]|uniref:neuronal acetylcholine receptor subunit alpha-3-like n=1 Tax=Ruditapes philippinarum TaxID=129788 RepID=UPI00295AB45E|nr:neuronal acetylcholine receptor subunit alpha-3-like [Ruditapes philippinarum]
MPVFTRKIKSTFLVALYFLVYVSSAQAIYSPFKETEIRNEAILNSSYDPVSRPDSQTNVKIGLSILAMDELDLKGQKLTMAGWLTFEWEDHRIRWNKTEKDDIEDIFCKPKHIWKPELIVDNALEDIGLIKNDDLVLRLKYTGEVEWEPPILFATHCKVDITYYPYDNQKCSVRIVSWTYTIEEVKLETRFNEINLEDFEVHGEWDLTDTLVDVKNLTEHLPDGTRELRTQFYNLNVMMPIILTSLMVALVFIVPVDSGEKVSYVLTVFLSLAVLLTIVTDSLPPTSITLSVLGLYLGIVLIFTAIGILLTILILILFHKEGRPKPGSFVETLTHHAARLICCNIPGLQAKSSKEHTGNKVSPMTETLETQIIENSDFEDELNKAKDELDSLAETEAISGISWKDVAEVLDRFCFFSFAFITIAMNVAFVVTLAYGGQITGHD